MKASVQKFGISIVGILVFHLLISREVSHAAGGMEWPEPKATETPFCSLLFDSLAGHGEKPHEFRKSAPPPAAVSARAPRQPNEPVAILPDGKELRAHNYGGGLHGASIPPEEVIAREGFSGYARTNWNLKEHVLEHLDETGSRDTAFRGTTHELSTIGGRGAADWAGEGGYVYDIGPIPTWDVNLALDGRIKNAVGTYSGNPLAGEAEYAIPRAVPLFCIKGWYKVILNLRTERINGLATRESRVSNPHYDSEACKRHFGLP